MALSVDSDKFVTVLANVGVAETVNELFTSFTWFAKEAESSLKSWLGIELLENVQDPLLVVMTN